MVQTCVDMPSPVPYTTELQNLPSNIGCVRESKEQENVQLFSYLMLFINTFLELFLSEISFHIEIACWARSMFRGLNKQEISNYENQHIFIAINSVWGKTAEKWYCVLFRYWGWGREDDEFYVRMKEQKLDIRRPDTSVVTTGKQTFRHIHDRVKRPRDNKRYYNQKVSGSHRDRHTGLNTVEFTVTETYPISINQAPATVYNVELGCDRQDTPWCEHPSQWSIVLYVNPGLVHSQIMSRWFLQDYISFYAL